MKSSEMASEFDLRYNIVDKHTPYHSFMAGRYKQSFAYFTLRHRLPITLTTIVDSMTRDKDELVDMYGELAREEIKHVIGELSKLKYRLQTDKTLQPFTGNEPDKAFWNDFLVTLSEEGNSFFQTCWLYAECYMYRKISSFFEATKFLHDFDYFAKQKMNALIISVDAMELVLEAKGQLENNDDSLKRLLKLNLWGNRCDLSISSGKEVRLEGNPMQHIATYDANIICDDSSHICNCLKAADKTKPIIVDFICDNAGYELFTDFVLADFLIDKNWVQKVRFNVKAIPWFVSDVTPRDFAWTLDYMKEHSSKTLSEWAKRWINYMEQGKFELAPVDYFWTSPYEFFKMRDLKPDLYDQLTESHLIIFKGDLNYRKLIGDYTWSSTEAFVTCLRGFQPANLCSLRTVKADLICGLTAGLAEELNQKDKDWMTTGQYGTIQFAERLFCGCDP